MFHSLIIVIITGFTKFDIIIVDKSTNVANECAINIMPHSPLVWNLITSEDVSNTAKQPWLTIPCVDLITASLGSWLYIKL